MGKFQELNNRLVGVGTREQAGFSRRIAGLERRAHRGQSIDRGWASLVSEIEASCVRVATRRASLPVPDYPSELPVVSHRKEIARAIVAHQVVIICGDTGSGKTTQLPKICLELGRGAAGLIGHTQPRRIAARSVAMRIAEELKTQVGQGVGFKVRFSDHVNSESYLKLMTDGILLAEMQQDPLLSQYDTLIIDEAHERTLNIDFLLGYIKRLLPQRPDLKVIITSATIDPERFSRHFKNAPILKIAGRTYPVEVRYRPLITCEANADDRSLTEGIVEACAELGREGSGDILVFLPGEREIREAAEALRKHHPPHSEILPLYARLSMTEQHRVFEAHSGRRIVLATNVAETSLTVPGIRYVVDAGTARISRYSWRIKLQRLPIEPISKASADQRKGRCGRVGPGVCIRLYSEDDFNSRSTYTDPEIQRTNLASVVLQMRALGLGEIADFPFMDPPDPRLVKDAYRLLEELHAVDAKKKLTDLGRRLARLPLDPRLGRMLLAAEHKGALREVLVIVSALAVQDPRERPTEYLQAADTSHKRFQDNRSDFLSYLNLWTYYHEQVRHHSTSQLRKLCKREFLSWMRMREWVETWRQLRSQLFEMGLRENQKEAEYDAIHCALLSGLLSHVGFRLEDKRDKGAYLGARNRKFHIFPSSGLNKHGPKWLMAAEISETARTYARTVAYIRAEWIEQIGSHLLKHHVFGPYWEQHSARVGAYDRISLYGLIIHPRKRVDFARSHPTEARELFIRHALVYGEFRSHGGFLVHNLELIKEIETLEAKARRPDILVDEHVLFEFYDRLVPNEIHNGKAFESWRVQAEREHPQLLYLSRKALMQHEAEAISTERFPEQITAGPGLVLPLQYRLDPGDKRDGVTITVPLAALNQIDLSRSEWLVPGLLEEKITTLIRGLPKGLRKHFVPVPDFARACTQALEFGHGDLLEALSHQLNRMTGVEVPLASWDLASLPQHLRIRFEILDDKGKMLDAGRDLPALTDRLKNSAMRVFEAIPKQMMERDEVTDWDFGALPDSVDIQQQGLSIKGYPALVREGDHVALRLLNSRDRAMAAHLEGLIALLRHVLREQVKYLDKHLPHAQSLCMYFISIGRCELLKNDLVDTAIEQVFLDLPLPRSQEVFAARLESGRSRLVDVCNELAECMNNTLSVFYRIRQSLKSTLPLSWIEAITDINDQLVHLIYPGFIRATPAPYRQRLPRYLKAIERRLERLGQQPGKDRHLRMEIEPLWARCKQRWGDGSNVSDALREYRWQIEELRVSLFAQELGTANPVSISRLDKQWQKVIASF